ncbi:MAG TPA: hypothetical protein VMT54_17800 [Candidatus Cybelea sp.]|nr:hypothetical protein [Candidatus Cybelea sp.]
MAVEQIVFDELKRFAPAKILCLGYPDLLLTETVTPAAGDDAARIASYHGWKGPIAETTATFAAIGLDPVYIDVHASRHVERIVDLNRPVPEDLHGAFDLVLDPGTLEHCFNIGQAFENIVTCLKPKGTVIHANPVTMTNHGFWNISPTAYHDWYQSRGFDRVEVRVYWGPTNQRNVVAVDPVKRYKLPPEAICFVTASRSHAPAAVEEQWPTQTKYKRNPSLMAAAGGH